MTPLDTIINTEGEAGLQLANTTRIPEITFSPIFWSDIPRIPQTWTRDGKNSI